MSRSTTSIATPRAARYSLLTLELPGKDPATVGVLLEDPETDSVHIRLRRDWQRIAADEAEVLSLLEDDLRSQADEVGGGQTSCEHSKIHFERHSRKRPARGYGGGFSSRSRAPVPAACVGLKPQPFVTHLPRYSLAVAAGPFLENRS